jgi:hypothetical protein
LIRSFAFLLLGFLCGVSLVMAAAGWIAARGL